MPISIRVITIIDQKYTVEMEIEEDDWLTLWRQLKGTSWGKRVLYLVTTMLPNYPEVKKEDEPNIDSETTEKTEEETPSETQEA